MSDAEKTDRNLREVEYKPSRWRARLAWVLGATAIGYLAIAGLMFWNADTCISAYFDQSTWARFKAGLTCMTANEMGDMLAGMFAPLAFLGLIIAILLQGQDLELQRADQNLTRAVLEAQRDEARKTADFIGQQTEAVSAERVRASLDEIREGFSGFVRGPLSNRNWFGRNDQFYASRNARANFETFVMGVRKATDLENALGHMSTEELVWIMQLFEGYYQLAMDNPDIHHPSPDADAVQSAFFLIEEIATNRSDYIPGNAFIETELVSTSEAGSS